MTALPDDFDCTLWCFDENLDVSWMSAAACAASDVDPDMFFPEKHRKADAAREICLDCPVRAECYDWSQRSRTPEGVWGAESARARRKVRGQIARGEIAEPPSLVVLDARRARVAS